MAAELAALRTDYRSMASRTRLAQEGLADPTRFTVEARLAAGGRAGRLFTPHGEVATPAFVPASTRGTVRAVLPESLRDLGAQALLASAYHLELMPGAGVIEEAGGLGRFMNWPGATFTESGAFALSGGDPDAQANGAARKTRVDEDGVSFRSHVDGSDHRFTPETSMQLQHRIGADVLFALDSPLQSGDRTAQREAVERNLLWARRGLAEHNWQTAQRRSARSLWAVVGGGEFEDLRRRAARDLRDLGDEDRVGGGLGFGGYVLTGVPSGVAGDIARWATAELDDVRPRHLLGACEPVDLFAAVEAGVDTVDSAAPSRAAKVGTVYTVDGTYSVTDPAYRSDFRSLDPETINYTSQYTRAYVHHLFEAQEGLAITLVTIHNEQFLVSLMARIRQAIVDGDYLRFKEDFLRRFSGGPTREPAAL
ncbi:MULTISPECIES: tRNA guanosine(34) transglycosylase Tgt [unclassified Tsukamurella]|uniref:tRNA guanosine(34) transglycosylase Tgt n=1 Tax=unclassified Tsukamurella TaxID=2633480 RepID=UPI0031BA2E7E